MLFKQLLSFVALVTPLFVQGHSVQKRHDHKKSKCTDPISLAASVDDLSTVVAALKASDLIPAIEAGDKWTFFLPTNDAFEKLPKGTVETLLKKKNKKLLQKVL